MVLCVVVTVQVSDQNEAERRRLEADAVGVELDKQNAVIAARRDEAQRDLADAEPALLAAQQSVKCESSISKITQPPSRGRGLQ